MEKTQEIHKKFVKGIKKNATELKVIEYEARKIFLQVCNQFKFPLVNVDSIILDYCDWNILVKEQISNLIDVERLANIYYGEDQKLHITTKDSRDSPPKCSLSPFVFKLWNWNSDTTTLLPDAKEVPNANANRLLHLSCDGEEFSIIRGWTKGNITENLYAIHFTDNNAKFCIGKLSPKEVIIYLAKLIADPVLLGKPRQKTLWNPDDFTYIAGRKHILVQEPMKKLYLLTVRIPIHPACSPESCLHMFMRNQK